MEDIYEGIKEKSEVEKWIKDEEHVAVCYCGEHAFESCIFDMVEDKLLAKDRCVFTVKSEDEINKYDIEEGCVINETDEKNIKRFVEYNGCMYEVTKAQFSACDSGVPYYCLYFEVADENIHGVRINCKLRNTEIVKDGQLVYDKEGDEGSKRIASAKYVPIYYNDSTGRWNMPE